MIKKKFNEMCGEKTLAKQQVFTFSRLHVN